MNSRYYFPKRFKSKSLAIKPSFLSVDRGRVEPLEQTDKATPENRSDSALVHSKDNISIYAKRKAPLRELFGATNDLDHSSLVSLITSIAGIAGVSMGAC